MSANQVFGAAGSKGAVHLSRAYRGLEVLLLAVSLGACRVPAPQPPPSYWSRPSGVSGSSGAAAASAAPRWFGASEAEEAPAEAVFIDRPRRNERSPLGADLPLPEPGAPYGAFTDRFLHALAWEARTFKGRPSRDPLEVDENGWVRRLARDQVAIATVPAEPGARYVLSYAGDGRLELEGVSGVRPRSPRSIELTADGDAFRVRIERTSPASPIRSIRVLPERWADEPRVPTFDPVFLDSVDRFAVLRFARWMRVGSGAPGNWEARARLEDAVQTGPAGIAIEHMIDLSNQVGADPWIALPFGVTDAYAEALAELVGRRLRPGARLYLEYGDEASSPDRSRPGIQHMNAEAERLRLDPDPALARLLYQARRSVELFRIFERVLGRARLVRVLSAPVGAPATVRLLLRYEDTRASVDAVAVAPRVGWDLAAGASREATLARLEQEALPSVVAAVRAVAEVTGEVGVDLIAYSGGIELSTSDPPDRGRPPRASAVSSAALARELSNAEETSVVTLALLDAWRAAGGRMFVVGPLVGPGRPLPRLGARGEDAPRFEALLRFVTNQPRWWDGPPSVAEDASRPGDASSAPGAEAPSAARGSRGEPSPGADPRAVPLDPASSAESGRLSSAPDKLYTAPWVKWVSLGVSAALGVVAVERFQTAERAADRRDAGLAQLPTVLEAERFDGLQRDIRDAEDERSLAQGIGFVAVGLSSALIGWAIAQWLEEPPSVEPELPPWADARAAAGVPP